ncbi:FAD-binding protein [Thiotrichales bacterium 19S3-7]|nr:FAD-binding protein [Thiotrichales bacterium 19S3-7]MCF6801952.1 FAD-binding protein [Thiotrichales bacterium 19S3-11]
MNLKTDILIIGAGPVGLMCAYLGALCGMRIIIIDKSAAPLDVGRADALNARSLQYLEIIDLFKSLYPLGKTCNTSSVYKDGKFISRQSSWWEELTGCFHKHFLMLGQSHIENLLDKKLQALDQGVKRLTEVKTITLDEKHCFSLLNTGEAIQSRYIIAADGARSFVRNYFNIPFEITRPQITWAVIDGEIDTDFDKVPEIIVFQTTTSDVAWIPREGTIDRFYVRMDCDNFSLEDAIDKINRAITPHYLKFKQIIWFSKFSVKESVAEQFFIKEKIFLAGDACHIHSVNGGQGLNTGLADAFNLIWKINMHLNFDFPSSILTSYEQERKPIAKSVIKISGDLVRATKYANGTNHAQTYVKLIQRYSGYITGMGISYGNQTVKGSRLYDFEVHNLTTKLRIYSLLEYHYYTLLIFSDERISIKLPNFIQSIQIKSFKNSDYYWANDAPYNKQAMLVRPDSFIAQSMPLEAIADICKMLIRDKL